MKKILFCICIFLAIGTLSVQSQTPSHIEKALARYATPAKYHSFLKPLVGTWHGKFRLFLGPRTLEASGILTTKWVLGNRFLQQEFKGQLQGQSLDGLGMLGYDNAQRKYVATWSNNRGTGIAMRVGTCNSKGNVFTFFEDLIDPVTARKATNKSVIHIIDNNRYTFTLYRFIRAGREKKVFEIEYTRIAK